MIKLGNVVYRNIQEQVAKNTKDIALIQRRPVLQVKKVDELPEEGEEGIMYLLPASDPEIGNYFEEYLWIDSAWELIGSSAVDISNMCTTDTEQTITGAKTFTSDENNTKISIKNAYDNNPVAIEKNNEWMYLTHNDVVKMAINAYYTYVYTHLRPGGATYDLGGSSNKWKDIYISGGLKLSDPTNTYNWSQESDGGDGVNISRNGVAIYSYGYSNFRPAVNNQRDLGNSFQKWKNIYLAGDLSDGTNTANVADIAALITYAKAQGWIS